MKNGTLIFVRNKFKIKDIGTYMSVPIRSFMNIDNVLQGRPKIRFNHVGIFSNGYIYEAAWNKKNNRPEVIKTSFNEWLNGRDDNSYTFKAPIFELDSSVLEQTLENSLGKFYDFTSVLIAQPFRQLLFKRIWIGSRTSTKRFYCSELCAYSLFISTGKLGFTNYWEIDPEDLYISSLFK